MVVEVLAAGLNPVDVAICAVRFYAGAPLVTRVSGSAGGVPALPISRGFTERRIFRRSMASGIGIP